MTTRKKMHNFCNIFHLVKAWQRHLVDMYVKAKLRELQIAPRWWAELDVEGLVLISKLQVRYVRPNKRDLQPQRFTSAIPKAG